MLNSVLARPEEGLRSATVVSALVEMFSRLGAKDVFGVSGGAIAALWDALSSSALGVYHFRHESGAAFAAIEAGFASGRPTVVFTTTGPGFTNALTGIFAARDERARAAPAAEPRRRGVGRRLAARRGRGPGAAPRLRALADSARSPVGDRHGRQPHDGCASRGAGHRERRGAVLDRRRLLSLPSLALVEPPEVAVKEEGRGGVA